MSYGMVYRKQLAEQNFRRSKYRLRMIVRAAQRVMLLASHGRRGGYYTLARELEKAKEFLRTN